VHDSISEGLRATGYGLRAEGSEEDFLTDRCELCCCHVHIVVVRDKLTEIFILP